MKTTLAIFAVVALCIVGVFTWQSDATTRNQTGSPTVKIILTKGHGSGVYIGGGLILTVAHVVDNSKDGTVRIKTESGNILPGVVLWSSKARDVALVQVTGTLGLRPARLSCTTPQIGDAIHARGNPLSIEFFSAWGHVATSLRKVDPWLEAVGTDMTVLPGMSGGPVFGSDGAVVGIAVGVMIAQVGFGSMSLTGATLIVPGSTICPLLGRA